MAPDGDEPIDRPSANVGHHNRVLGGEGVGRDESKSMRKSHAPPVRFRSRWHHTVTRYVFGRFANPYDDRLGRRRLFARQKRNRASVSEDRNTCF